MTWQDLQQAPLSPLEELIDSRVQTAKLRLYIKRDDLLAVPIGHACNGNKWRKLKYNLLHVKAAGHSQLLSFGGIHANHIAALAAAGHDLGLATIGVIRGEDQSSPTLDLARACGMQLHFVDRSAYRQKMSSNQIDKYRDKFGDFYLIPEGGSNTLAINGCAELGQEIERQLISTTPDYLSVPCGTGGTLAGLTLGLGASTQTLGFSILKGDFLQKEVDQMLNKEEREASPWQIITDYHFGGYARWNESLIEFIQDFYQQHRIILDPVYGAKHFYGLFDLIEQAYFPAGTTIVAVHTGGLQGIPAFNQRFGLKLPTA